MDPALYQIGTSGVQSPADISVLAGGSVHYSAVIVDGVTVTPKQRGIVLALIDPATGKLRAAGGYDTYLATDESDRLAAAIAAAPDGTIVALATYEEGASKLNDAARAAIASLGGTVDLKDKIGAAYALIGVRARRRHRRRALRPGAAPVTADVGVGALPTRRRHLLQPDRRLRAGRITLLVQNSARGLLTVSEAAFPGWEAYVDGLPTPILRANGMQRAVVLPPALDGQPHESPSPTGRSARLGRRFPADAGGGDVPAARGCGGRPAAALEAGSPARPRRQVGALAQPRRGRLHCPAPLAAAVTACRALCERPRPGPTT